nr:type I restriction-modification system subunit M N-terminal domain-containing protein [Pseudomonas aeruginosa]
MIHPSKRITQQELESYLWGAAVLLRGLIDAGDYKQFIFPLLFYKRVSDVWDEEYQAALVDSNGDLSYAQFAENHRFQIPEAAHWNDVRQTPRCGFHAIRPPSPLSSGQAFHGHLATCSTAIRPGSRSAATQGLHC